MSISGSTEHRAQVRVFLPTYRRPALLPRAVASLQAQTFTDWVCEMHNDDPADPGPARFLARLGDPRFQLVTHERNLGGVATFNLVFRATPEPFYSLLEDDNWWEPGFLSTMIATAATHPGADIFWANMRVWEERADGKFTDTGRTINPWTPGESPRLVPWGGPEQIFGAIHSNGAMLVRSRPGAAYPTPDVPFAVVEPFRERSWRYPIVFVPAPLANYSLTLRSHRTEAISEWAALQTMLAASFLRHSGFPSARLADVWAAARACTPPHGNVLLFAALIDPECRSLLRHLRAIDLLRWLRSTIRHPIVALRILRVRRDQPDLWSWLDRACAERFAESRPRPSG